VINGGQYWNCEASAPQISNGLGDMNNFIEVKSKYAPIVTLYFSHRATVHEELPDCVHDHLGYVRRLMNKIHEECN